MVLGRGCVTCCAPPPLPHVQPVKSRRCALLCVHASGVDSLVVIWLSCVDRGGDGGGWRRGAGCVDDGPLWCRGTHMETAASSPVSLVRSPTTTAAASRCRVWRWRWSLPTPAAALVWRPLRCRCTRLPTQRADRLSLHALHVLRTVGSVVGVTAPSPEHCASVGSSCFAIFAFPLLPLRLSARRVQQTAYFPCCGVALRACVCAVLCGVTPKRAVPHCSSSSTAADLAQEAPVCLCVW